MSINQCYGLIQFINEQVMQQNHQASILTEYHDQQAPSPTQSKQELYSHRLEAKIRELRKRIKNNKPLIDQLKGQRKFFKKICEKQREKIESINISLIQEQYQKQISCLQEERFKLQDMIALIHEESDQKVAEYVQAKTHLKQNCNFLQKTHADVLIENESYEKIISNRNAQINNLSDSIGKLAAEIRDKQSVERKYQQAMRTIQNLQQQKE